jgi:methionine aminopeptidase
MIFLKTEEEIEFLRESNLLVSKTLGYVASLIKPGVTTLELDKSAETYIRDHGGVPTFKGYPNNFGTPFPATLCTSINDQIVHGIPSGAVTLKEGDIISVDCGVHTNEEIMVRVEDVITTTDMLQRIGLSDADTVEVLQWMKDNVKRLRNVSLRTALYLASFVITDRQNWKEIAEVTQLR